MNVIQHLIAGKKKDLGGFSVQRILPHEKIPMVGPFIFFDHMGPANFEIGDGIDVRPHPHIGLATLTYLFSGEIMHRDTLGYTQAITPGAVNWMIAGRGIAHSERTGLDERAHQHQLHGLQSWIALPKEFEECEPEFFHYPLEALPGIHQSGVELCVIAGEAYGKKAPVKTLSPLFYVEAHMEVDAFLDVPDQYSERAIYVVSGNIEINGKPIQASHFAVIEPGKTTITATHESHIMLLGGEPLAEPRHIFWNFVSSSPERIEQAKRDWVEGKFGKIPGDANEFIPLPEQPKPAPIL